MNPHKMYAGAIGFISGTGTWIESIGINRAFYGDIIKTIIIAIISTLTGLIVRHYYIKWIGKD